MTDEEQQKIQARYLKGISTQDLAMQFNQPEEVIEMVLRNKEIYIVHKQPPKPAYWRGKKSKKR